MRGGTRSSNVSPQDISNQLINNTNYCHVPRPSNTNSKQINAVQQIDHSDRKLKELVFAEQQEVTLRQIQTKILQGDSTRNTSRCSFQNNKSQLQSPKVLSITKPFYSPRLTKIMISSSVERLKYRERHKFRIEMNQKVIIEQLGEIKRLFFQMVHNVQREEAVESLLQLLVISVNQDNVDMLIDVYKLMSFGYICLGQWSKALMLLDQTRIICNLTRRYNDKIWALNHLAMVAKQLHRFNEAAIFIKKGLQYAWLLGDQEQELNCYDQLGILSYLQYKMEEGKILHKKSVDGNFEPEESALKSLSKRDLDKFISSLPEQTKNINSLLMSKSFNFPFKMIRNDDSEYYARNSVKNKYLISESLICVTSGRMTNFILCELDCLRDVLEQEEFKFEFPTPIATDFISYQITPRPIKNKEISGYRGSQGIKNRWCHIKNYNSHQTSQTFHLDQIHKKIPLKGQIDERVQKTYDSEQIFQQIYRTNCRQDLQNDITKLTHLTSNRNLGNYEFNKNEIIRFADKIFKQLIQSVSYQKI